MSIGKRLIDLARSELNSLLEKAARVDDDDDDDGRGGSYGSSEYASMSDTELSRGDRAAAAGARGGRAGRPATRRRPGAADLAPPPRRTAAGDRRSARPTPRWRSRPAPIFETVKRSYRRLMRKYHPDLNAGSKEKQRAATDLSQRLTEAYKTLEKHLRR